MLVCTHLPSLWWDNCQSLYGCMSTLPLTGEMIVQSNEVCNRYFCFHNGCWSIECLVTHLWAIALALQYSFAHCQIAWIARPTGASHDTFDSGVTSTGKAGLKQYKISVIIVLPSSLKSALFCTVNVLHCSLNESSHLHVPVYHPLVKPHYGPCTPHPLLGR